MTTFRPLGFATLVLVALIGSACAPREVSVEVLPPRTSITCAAPTVQDAALGRGIIDVDATENVHGGYIADLRFSVPAMDVRVDGIDVRLSIGGSELKVLNDVPTGDVVLAGDGDDVRRAVVEHVELLPRSVAVSLRDDGALDLSDVDFATVEVEIAPRVLNVDAVPVPSTFALDACRGCLVGVPAVEDCPGGVVQNPVCRVGQDVKSFTCVGGP